MGTDVQLLGDFDREATQDEQDAIVDQTRAVETLYDDIPYTVDQARITDDVESPTRAKYHGRQDSTVQVSLRSMEMDDIEGVWAHELGHDMARQTFYDEIADEPRLYRTTVDETFAYLVQYEVMDDAQHPGTVAARYFAEDEAAWEPLRSAMDPDVLEERATDLQDVADELHTGYSQDLLEVVSGLHAGDPDTNMFVSDLPISTYLEGAQRLRGTISLLQRAVDDGELDRERLGEELWEEVQDGDSAVRYDIESELQDGARDRLEQPDQWFATRDEIETAMEAHAYEDGLDVVNALTADAIEDMNVGIDEQQKLAEGEAPSHWAMEAVRDEKYGYGTGSRTGHDQYIDFPHGAGRLMASVLYEEDISSRAIIEAPDRIMRAGKDLIEDLIGTALDDGSPAEEAERYAREGLTLHRVIGQ